MITINKGGAIELSIGTVVIIVLAMSMLVLGLILVGKIFGGATTNVDEINKGVQDKVKELFQDNKAHSVIYLTQKTAEVGKGEEYGVVFGVRNLEEGNNEIKNFTYTTELADTNIDTNCGVDAVTANGWIRFGSGTIKVKAGDIGFPPIPIRIHLPENAPLCTTSYYIEIKEDGMHYDTQGFILKIVP